MYENTEVPEPILAAARRGRAPVRAGAGRLTPAQRALLQQAPSAWARPPRSYTNPTLVALERRGLVELRFEKPRKRWEWRRLESSSCI